MKDSLGPVLGKDALYYRRYGNIAYVLVDTCTTDLVPFDGGVKDVNLAVGILREESFDQMARGAEAAPTKLTIPWV